MTTRYRSEEYKNKRSLSKMGHSVSEETKRKIGDAQIGEKNHMFGKHHTTEHNKQVSDKLKGRIFTDEHRQKLSAWQIGKAKPWLCGENHPNWKGGLTQEKVAGRPKPELCELCGGAGRICFDHDHVTGNFRGWICSTCNTALGHARDNPELLYKMISYLNKSRGLVIISEVQSSLANVPLQ